VSLNEEHVIFYDLLQFLFGRMQHGTFCDSISRSFDSLNEGCAKVGIAQDETPVNSPDIGLAASFSTDRYLARRVYGCPKTVATLASSARTGPPRNFLSAPPENVGNAP
jgi:hypothetical protein